MIDVADKIFKADELYELGRWREAWDAYEDLLENHEDELTGYSIRLFNYRVAKCAWESGDGDSALERIKDVLRVHGLTPSDLSKNEIQNLIKLKNTIMLTITDLTQEQRQEIVNDQIKLFYYTQNQHSIVLPDNLDGLTFADEGLTPRPAYIELWGTHKFTNCSFDIDIGYATFNNSDKLHISNRKLTECTFTNLSSSYTGCAYLERCGFNEVDHTEFFDCLFENSNFRLPMRHNKFKDSTFDNCIITESDLYKNELNECTIKNSVINSVVLAETNLRNVTFENNKINGMTIAGGVLSYVVFYGCNNLSLLISVETELHNVAFVRCHNLELKGLTDEQKQQITIIR